MSLYTQIKFMFDVILKCSVDLTKTLFLTHNKFQITPKIVSSLSWFRIKPGPNPRFSKMQKLLRNLLVFGKIFTVKIIDFHTANAMKIDKPFPFPKKV